MRGKILWSILQFYPDLYELSEKDMNYWKLFHFIFVIFSIIENVIVHASGNIKSKINNKKNESHIRLIEKTLFP